MLVRGLSALAVALWVVVAPEAGTSPHWLRGVTIATWIDPQDMPAGAYDLVGRAMSTWTTAAAGRFTLRTKPMPPALLRIHFIRSTSRFGETEPLADPNTGLIVDADVRITTEAQGDALDRQIVVYLTALHEIGHALGLAHRDDFNSIMYLFKYPNDPARYFGRYRALVRSAADIGSASASGLSPADVVELRALYD